MDISSDTSLKSSLGTQKNTENRLSRGTLKLYEKRVSDLLNGFSIWNYLPFTSKSGRKFVCGELFGEIASTYIKDSEWKDIQILFGFLGKRVLSGLEHWESSPKKDETHNNGIFVHDVVHSCIRYMREPDSINPKKYIPEPFQHPFRGWAEDKISTEEEIFALLWKKKLFINKTHIGHYIDSQRTVTRKEFIDEYVPFTMHYWRDFWLPPELKNTKAGTTHKNLIREIKSNPPEKLRDLLGYIFDNQSNPRVMIDLFLDEMQPLIDQIKKRKPYTGEKRRNNTKQNPPLS